ncbi:hypothetical protein SCHPADRAFT_665907 [Schizopora paradoxa]|uniref:STE3-domain-containing protein n=1 Tax=Schizopora paradoxa TaxID=27342 RepID=A0A0H2R6T1_9AGAM|nr:hypothetical protein SCHPADRAFT_665907 [Schizopora paradoxa]
MIVGLPLLIMGLKVIVQPIRFQILEELGCLGTTYSYVAYIIDAAPCLIANLGCIALAPLTLRVFLRHRKEMGEFLSTTRSENGYSKIYYRLVFIACLDTLFNAPVLLINVITTIVQGQEDSYNFPYISWKNVHDGAGGNFPGTTLSTIFLRPASEWSTNKWVVYTVKWDEWLYVVHAIIFFAAFGTTPDMRQRYLSVLWFVPERLGYKRRQVSQTETVSDLAFNSNPNPRAAPDPTGNKHSSPSHLNTINTIMTTGATRSMCLTWSDSVDNEKGSKEIPPGAATLANEKVEEV